MSAALPSEQRRALKSRAHALKPVVTVGAAGLSGAVLAEVAASLAHHELMKVRLPSGDRGTRMAMIGTLCQRLDAALVQELGFVVTLYRKRPQKKKRAVGRGKPKSERRGKPKRDLRLQSSSPRRRGSNFS